MIDSNLPAASSNNTMSSINEPPMSSRSHTRTKSASIEANNETSLSPGSPRFELDPISTRASKFDDNYYDEIKSCQSAQDVLAADFNQLRNNTFHGKAKKLLSMPSRQLKPSVSTSCLFTALSSSQGSSESDIIHPTRASLTHEWKKLKTPNKCRECNLLVYFNGRECSFCGFVAHKKCVSTLVIKCSGQQAAGLKIFKSRKAFQLQQQQQQQPSTYLNGQQTRCKSTKPTIRPIFGQPIGPDNLEVVDFLRRFIYEIDTRGLTAKGIYRVSSIKSKVDKLCNYYDQNLSSLIDLSAFHPNIIANALKMYLRQLPEPLLTHQLYESFIEVAKKYANQNAPNTMQKQATLPSTTAASASTKPRKTYHYSPCLSTNITETIAPNLNYDPMLIVELSEIIDLLPIVNKQLVAIIMRHLKRVSDMSTENQMNALNLSIIFGPTLLSTTNKTLAIVDNIHQARAVELMIIWANQIFPQYENYESKAVIDLELPELQLQHHQQRLSISSGSSDKASKTDSKSNQNKRVQDKISKLHNLGRRLSRQSPKEEDRPSKIDKSPETNTEDPVEHNVDELRRKFFGETTSDEVSRQEIITPASITILNFTPTIDLPAKRSNLRNINQSGSVPVIKVQPCYCNPPSDSVTRDVSKNQT